MTRTVDIPEDIYNWLVEESTRRGCTIAEFIEWDLEQARQERRALQRPSTIKRPSCNQHGVGVEVGTDDQTSSAS